MAKNQKPPKHDPLADLASMWQAEVDHPPISTEVAGVEAAWVIEQETR